jgi:ubiquitin carboxyl-terminal hydrolase 9/24
VKGELLEGDNAYFCEKCHEKRNAIKRMCIRTLPQTLVIQVPILTKLTNVCNYKY